MANYSDVLCSRLPVFLFQEASPFKFLRLDDFSLHSSRSPSMLSVGSAGHRLSSRAENHLCERSVWIIFLLESKVTKPTLQTQQKLMRTEIQALRDMGTSWKVTESVHKGTVAWEKGRFRSFTNYHFAFPLFPTGKATRKSRVVF